MSSTEPKKAHAEHPAGDHGGGHGGGAFALLIGAVGVVFGDLGTSPLYALQECFSGPHGMPATRENVLGIVSLVLWSLTLVVTVKYLAFLMQADNKGEGGILALLALVPERLRTATPGKVAPPAILVVAGAALLFGDGVITPAISVLSAVEGLEVATASAKPFVIPITIAILIGLFAIQRSGTGKLGVVFGPIMIVWFITIAALGTRAAIAHPEVFAALSPKWGFLFFREHGLHGIRTLGGVVLCVTGGEALYADMGHFGRKPIQRAWIFICLPALFLSYLGQGANILVHPEAAKLPFYALCPKGPLLYPIVLLAAAATVIASQALVSGVFSLTRQAMQLGFFPRVEIKHTSADAEGQIYVPFLNWALAISCITLVLAFKSSAALAAAFGLAVSGTMGITSVAFFMVTRSVWKWDAWKAYGLLLLFLATDIPFFVANLLKFFDGGWLPAVLGAAMSFVMIVWNRGRTLLGERFSREARPLTEQFAALEARAPEACPGVGVFMASTKDGTPAVFARLFDRFATVYDTNVFLTVRIDPVPRVNGADRVTVEPIRECALGAGSGKATKNVRFLRVLVRFGYLEEPNVPGALRVTLANLAVLDPAATGATGEIQYLLGKERIVPSPAGRFSGFSEQLFAFLSRNALAATDLFGLPPDHVVEIGSQIDL